jgi:hypothetical protein
VVVDNSPVDAGPSRCPLRTTATWCAAALAVVAVGVLAFVVEQRSLVGAGREVRTANREWLGVAVLA